MHYVQGVRGLHSDTRASAVLERLEHGVESDIDSLDTVGGISLGI